MGATRLPASPEPESEHPLRLLAWIFGSLIAAIVVLAAIAYGLFQLNLGHVKQGPIEQGGRVENSPAAIATAKKFGVSRIPKGYAIMYVGEGEQGRWVRLVSS